MSWRRFAALLAGLGPTSRLMMALGAERGGRGAARVVEDPEEASRVVRQLFGGLQKRGGGRGAQGR